MTASDRATPVLTIRLLGACEVQLNGAPIPLLRSGAGQWLLPLLALRHGQAASRDWLASTLWPESLESHALYNLRRSLSDLRHALGSEARCILSPTPRSLRLDLACVKCDLVEFDNAVQRRDPDSLSHAISLYRGPLLEGCFEEWILQEREKREQGYLTALETLADAANLRGEHRAAADYLRLAVNVDPLRECAQRELMTSLAHCGDYGAAVQVYRDLRATLRAQLNVEPDSKTRAAYERIRSQADQQANKGQLSRKRDPSPALTTRIPYPITRLVGRKSELREIASRVRASRLVTLTGTGGIGKTRLAIQTAHELSSDYADAACLVTLATLTDPELVPHSVASTLGIADDPKTPPTVKLCELLQTADLLLVLDNCEHLRLSCAALVHTLLEACSGLRILATSREPLGITGEVAWQVPSLPLPPDQDEIQEDPVAQALAFDSVSLFVERAAQADSHFVLAPSNVHDVVRVCQGLDGNPLALELAAARVRSMTPAQIADSLDDRFNLLIHGSVTGPARHQSLSAMIDWSYQLLNSSEKALFEGLAVYSGGWTADSARACFGGDIDDPADTLDSLVRKSLVVRDSSRVERFQYLETVREYALERLEESGQADHWRQAHLRHFLALAEEAEPHLWTRDQLVWLDRLESDYSNLRAALEWSVIQEADLESGPRLIAALAQFWWLHSHYGEGRKWIELALGHRGRLGVSTLAKFCHYAAAFAHVRGEHDAVSEYTEQAQRLFRSVGNQWGEALALILGSSSFITSCRPQAGLMFRHALELARLTEDPWLQGFVLVHVACVESDYDRSLELFDEALELARRVGERWCLAVTLLSLADRHTDWDRAEALNKEALAVSRELGERRCICGAQRRLAEIALHHGNTDHARTLFNEASGLALRIEVNDPFAMTIQPETSA